jgi:hypothetical protein
MSEDTLNFEDHRRRREHDPDLVRCARCGKTILGTSTRCPECGVHFQGAAEDFSHQSESGRGGTSAKPWVVVVALLLLLAMLLTVFGLR